jgi:hypothetical protein
VDKVVATEETNEPRKKNKRTDTKRILNDWQRNDKNKGLEFTEDLYTLVFMFFLLGRRLDEDLITPFYFIFNENLNEDGNLKILKFKKNFVRKGK